MINICPIWIILSKVFLRRFRQYAQNPVKLFKKKGRNFGGFCERNIEIYLNDLIQIIFPGYSDLFFEIFFNNFSVKGQKVYRVWKICIYPDKPKNLPDF